MDYLISIIEFIGSVFRFLLGLGLWLIDNIVLLVILIVLLGLSLAILRLLAGVVKVAFVAGLILLLIAALWWLWPESNDTKFESPQLENSPTFVI